MSLSEVRILWSMLRGQQKNGTLKERLEHFYSPQASRYDSFREKLLHGRQEMIQQLGLQPGMKVIEIGGGTARNLEFYADLIPLLQSVEVVDLCGPLLEQARMRCEKWPNVKLTECDAAMFSPAEPADRVYLSYSLTMMPQWRQVVDNVVHMLAPDGKVGLVDFYMSSGKQNPGAVAHGILSRRFWPRWFAHDGVFLEPERLNYLLETFKASSLQERLGSVPFLPGLRVPYYIFTGQRGD